jgi:hypothetical protein
MSTGAGTITTPDHNNNYMPLRFVPLRHAAAAV